MSSIAPTEDGVVRIVLKGALAEFFADETRYVDLEGAFRCGKTTACCLKVAASCLAHPGINWLICRWTDDDTHAILKPVWRAVLQTMGVTPRWDGSEHCDVLPNGSRVYIRGLKPQQETSRYGKLRGMTLAGVYNDQTEELPKDFYDELKGRLSQKGYPHQMLLSPNPEFSEDHYLATEFPESQTRINHRYYSVPIHANAHNLQADVIPALEAAYPPGSAKHRPAILGRRGVKVLGKPVYAGYFSRAIHERSVPMNPQIPLLESIDFGKHHPAVVWAQCSPYGGFHVLGALMGLDLFIDDFVPMLLRFRAEWFPNPLMVHSCCDPAGSHNNSQGVRLNGVSILRDHGIGVVWLDNSNAVDVRGGAIDRLAAYMRRRTPVGEAFSVDPDRQVIVSAQSEKQSKFLTDGLEAGYVWDPHMKSVGAKPMRSPLKDGWYEHGMNCMEYLELHYGGAQPSQQQVERRAERTHAAAIRRAQIDSDPFRWGPSRSRRGGY